MKIDLLLVLFFLFLSFYNLYKLDFSGFIFFLIPSLVLIISRYYTIKRIKEDNIKKRKDFFHSLLKNQIKTTKEGNSTIISLVVPSPDFFQEMSVK
jgi:hypothetical protein